MTNLKTILNITSFAKIVGYAQPSNTCPMIDEAIRSYKYDISSLDSDISSLESSLDSLKEEEDPSIREIEKLESKLSTLDEQKRELEGFIEGLEEDRETINGIRKKGLELRSDFLNLLDDCIDLETSVFFAAEIRSWTNYHDLDPKTLNTDNSDICKNYDKIIEWAQAWGDAGDSFYDNLSSKFFCIENDLNITHINAKAQIKWLLEGDTNCLLLFPLFYKKCLPDYIENDCYVYSNEKNHNDGFFSSNKVEKIRSYKYKAQILGFNIEKLFAEYQSSVSSCQYSPPSVDFLAMDESIHFEDNEHYSKEEY